MKRTIFAIFGAVVATTMGRQAIADFRAKPLSPDMERRWINAVNDYKTMDGSTVRDVINNAVSLRPKKFRLYEASISYSRDGMPTGASVCYFIGSKKSPGDEICDLGFSISSSGGAMSVTPNNFISVKALLAGRDAFLNYVDGVYNDACVDASTRERIC